MIMKMMMMTMMNDDDTNSHATKYDDHSYLAAHNDYCQDDYIDDYNYNNDYNYDNDDDDNSSYAIILCIFPTRVNTMVWT